MLRQEVAELPHLVPEHGVRPVIDVEVVVLDVWKDGSGECQLIVECLTRPSWQQRAVLIRDPIALGQHRVKGAVNVPPSLDALDVGANHRDRQRRVVDPRSVMVIEPVAVGEAEPWVLGPAVLRQPLLAGHVLGQRAGQVRLVVSAADLRGDTKLGGAHGQALELIIWPQRNHVEARDHLRDRDLGDVRERLPADLVEGEVGAVTEIHELKVVVTEDGRSSPANGHRRRGGGGWRRNPHSR